MTAVTDVNGKTERAPVTLVPWDPESDEHVKRIYDQRVACGWKYQKVEEWRELQREGKMALHWVVLRDEDPDKAAMLLEHQLQYPVEAIPLLDTAGSLAGKARSPPPSETPFIPIGHISLDFYHADANLADPTRGIYYISTFYISRALQGRGLGRAAMDAVERMAREAPLSARALALDTLTREQSLDVEWWRREGMQAPQITNQDWYARRGYEIFKREPDYYVDVDQSGQKRTLAAVFMKKTIG